MSSKLISYSSLVALPLLLSACVSAPFFSVPSVSKDVPSEWDNPLLNSTTFDLTDSWWQMSDDKDLIYLVNQGFSNSPSVLRVQSRVREAASAYSAAVGQALPDATASVSRSYSKQQHISDSFQIALSQGIDISGGLAASRLQASASQNGVNAQLDQAKLELADLIARAYYGRIHAQLELGVLARKKETLIKLKALTESKIKAGLSDPTAHLTYDSQINQVELDYLQWSSKKAAYTASLNKLTGGSSSIPEYSGSSMPESHCSPNVPVPASLLQRRFDVKSAESAMEVAFHQVTIAKSARFPKISLSGNISINLKGFNFGGQQGGGFGGSQSPRNINWSWGPSISLPIFDASIAPAIAQADEKYLQAIQDYREVVLTAVSEVESAMADVNHLDSRITALFVLDKNAKKETDKAISLYKAGLSSELDLKTQELSNLSVESNINLTNLNLILSQLTLFKSLGGAPHA